MQWRTVWTLSLCSHCVPIPQCIIVTALSYFKAHVYPKLFKYHICLYVNDEWVNVTLVYL